jgi:hypothetical protein
MTIKLMLSFLALALLVSIGAAYDGHPDNPSGPGYQTQYEHPDGGSRHDRHDWDQDRNYHFSYNYDWLSPGYAYSYWYPTTYYYNWYPTTAYTYYYTPATYPVYYSTPVVYDWVADPWWAANVYGVTGTTYYYSSGSSWHYGGGYYLGP